MAHYTAKRLQTCEAWQYEKDKPIPVWVAKKCHFLEGGDALTANCMIGTIPVNYGEYIVKVESDDGEFIGVMVCDKVAFEKDYEPAPIAYDKND